MKDILWLSPISPSGSVREEVVDVVVRDLGEGRSVTGGLRLRLLPDLLEETGELAAGLLHAKTNEPERASLVEDDDQDHAIAHEGHVEIVALALVEVDGELFLTHDLGEAAGRRDAARRERSEAGAVDALHLAGLADQLPGLVDDEDPLRVRVTHQLLDDGADLVKVLRLHHELG